MKSPLSRLSPQGLLNQLLFFPTRDIERRPEDAGLEAREVTIPTEDGERLHGWWVAGGVRSRGSILLCHGNGGNVGDRVDHARLLTGAGFAVLLFDYRGYGRSTGRPSEEGTYRDARAARRVLLEQEKVDESRIVYLGESLGGAVALALAIESPPAGLVLQSTFTGVRDMARVHYPFLPGPVIPDAYPSLERIERLRSPLLVLHGEADEIVPCAQARELLEAAPEPKEILTFPGRGHNDLVSLAGEQYAEAIGSWWDRVGEARH